jgi:hypothetical protein
MIETLPRLWNRLWFEPASRRQFIAVRTIVAAYTLWLVLSRPMMWAITMWPAPIFPSKYPDLLARFGLVLSPAVEHVLYRLIPALLLLLLLGIFARSAALVSAGLLYHFAPLEEFFAGIFSNGHSGFAFSVLSLLIIAFVPSPRPDPSEDYRWPVVMIQMFLALQYLLGGLSKVRFTGIQWYSGPNIAATAEEMATLTGAPWGRLIAQSLTLSWILAIATLTLEFLFPLVLFSRRARWVLVPAALAAQFLRMRIYGLYLIGWPLLAIFVNWDWVLDHVPAWRPVVRASATATVED